MVWDYTETEYKKQAQEDSCLHIERLINDGLNGEKLDRELTKKCLPHIRISDNARAFLELILLDKSF